MMWSTTLANLIENLSKIALDVHDNDFEDEDDRLSEISNNDQRGYSVNNGVVPLLLMVLIPILRDFGSHHSALNRKLLQNQKDFYAAKFAKFVVEP
ncbi:hypothetical protein Tco_1283952 [Tanacetum coccineum]